MRGTRSDARPEQPEDTRTMIQMDTRYPLVYRKTLLPGTHHLECSLGRFGLHVELRSLSRQDIVAARKWWGNSDSGCFPNTTATARDPAETDPSFD
jgi:hypothetical protein